MQQEEDEQRGKEREKGRLPFLGKHRDEARKASKKKFSFSFFL